MENIHEKTLTHEKTRNRTRINTKILCSLVFFFALFSVQPVRAQTATLYLSPSTGNYTVGTTFSVVVKVSSGGILINAAEGSLIFNTEELNVVSLSKSGSIFTLWTTEPTFSNSAGTIEFEGGTPTSFSGAAGTIVTITFKVKKSATANLNFISGAVLAADGKGTNVLANMSGGTYTLKPGIITPPAEEVPPEEYVAPPTVGAPAAPVIFSLTHSDENKWYSNNDPEFNWQLPPDVTKVSYAIDQNPTTNPKFVAETLIDKVSFTDLEDDIWYFHINFKNQYGWGKLTHRKVLIDTEPPKPFEIKVDNGRDPTNPTPILHFKTEDDLSGLEYYEVQIDEEPAAAAAEIEKNPYQPLPQLPGKHFVEVRAFDKAGNFSSATTEFEILPIEPPKITKIPKSIRIGEVLKIEGEAKPEITVRIYIQRLEKEPVIEKVTADLEGKWTLSYEKPLAKGDYLIWAQAEDKRGALSYPTKKYPLGVGLPPFLKIGKIALDYLTTMITLIILIVGALVVIFYSWYRISLWRKRVRTETKEVSQSVLSAFRALRDEVEEQIEYLDGKPGMTKDERQVRDKLKEALNISEEFISKEIKDIEKELE